VLGLPSEQVPESLAGALRVQAAQGAARTRWFLAEDDVESTNGGLRGRRPNAPFASAGLVAA